MNCFSLLVWLGQRNGLNSNWKMREWKLRSVRSKRKAGKQGQGNQYNNLQNWIGGKVEVKQHQQSLRWEHCRAFHSLSRYRNIEPFLKIVLNFDPFHPILDSDIDENYDHVKIDVWRKYTHHTRPMFKKLHDAMVSYLW